MSNEANEHTSVVLISNYLNHHMLPLCLELNARTNGNFRFIATTDLRPERANLGYKRLNEEYDFVVRAYENHEEKKRATKLCYDCDVLIYGHAPQSFYSKRLLHHKVTFRYSERILKTRLTVSNSIKLVLKYLYRDAFTQYSKHYLLAASAYASDDFNRFGAFKERSLRFGYFPPVLNEENRIERDKNEKTKILWVGRFIPYKQPQLAIEIARELKQRNLPFQMTIIGTGALEEEIKRLITEYDLEDVISMEGSKPNDVVRSVMQTSDILLFTSNEEEGWGAVLNEAMDSGCVCVAYKGIGSVPFLIDNGNNGFAYENHSSIEIADICEKIINDRSLREKIGDSAKKSISEMWNAKVASERLLDFAENIKNGQVKTYDSGPLSKAERLRCSAK